MALAWLALYRRGPAADAADAAYDLVIDSVLDVGSSTGRPTAPLGVDANVRGAKEEEINHVTARDAEWSVVAEPGDYILTASYPGYLQIERTITVAPPNADGRIEGDVTSDVALSPVK